ncbi:uncharacterized protein LOC110066842 isoform X3 [Orbicella faveolata]|uniref:uncharacterized protein LOC110066842 isoform X3 n=1 Tax=Orbicella faveolata TaxID=48498 RepID=UPI0009E563C9|nr:uncharacterized protein LOC110066842 isoform X3 [Orbicella faveolata]
MRISLSLPDQHTGATASSPTQESCADQHTGATASSPTQESCADQHTGATASSPTQESCADQHTGATASSPTQESCADQHTGATASSPTQESCADQHTGATASSPTQESCADQHTGATASSPTQESCADQHTGATASSPTQESCADQHTGATASSPTQESCADQHTGATASSPTQESCADQHTGATASSPTQESCADQHTGATASSPTQESCADQHTGATASSPTQESCADQHTGATASSPTQESCADQHTGATASSPTQESCADQHTGATASSPTQESCADQHTGATASSPTQESCAGACRDFSQLPQTIPHFVGRVEECDAIRRYLCPTHNCRCVLVHGVTGVGKTSTAIKVANDRLNSDSRTVVVYVNCRCINSLDDFAGKVLQQVYHYPVEDPISELKNRLKSQDRYTVLLLDNFEFLLHLGDIGQETPHEGAMVQNSACEESKIMNYITEMVKMSRKIKLLITSSEKVVFPGLGQEKVHLACFNPEESFQLLQKACGERVENQQCVHQLSEICSGIPLVLYTLALSHSDLLTLVKLMNCSSPHDKFEFLRKIQAVPKEEKIGVCLDICFGRLTEQEKNTLITLALLRERFTLPRAEQIFRALMVSEHQLSKDALELAKRSLLEQNIVGGVCFYTFLRVIREYCGKKASDQPGFREVFVNARNVFIDHFFTFLAKTFRLFLSKNASDAITDFQQDEENIMQLIEWCDNGEMTADQIGICIDFFNSVGELLAKMIGKEKYEFVFKLLRRKSEEMRDQKRLSECLTSLGIKQVFHCSCSPGLCGVAAERAKEYLVEGDRIQSSLDLDINTGNSRAQCLSKLGRCLAKEGQFLEGKEKIQQAIDIRRRHGDEDIIMLAATYNDMAVALSLEGDHQEAILVRERQTLPIYREQLGDHPFTATILNNLSNNYYALGQYDNAKQYSDEALRMRLELLKDHRDTAKSLFDLGMVHKERGELQEAKECLERSQTIQEKVLDDNIRDLQRTRDEIEELRNRLAHQQLEQDRPSRGTQSEFVNVDMVDVLI